MYKVSDSDYQKAWALSNHTISHPNNFKQLYYIFTTAKHIKPPSHQQLFIKIPSGEKKIINFYEKVQT